jgi:hypothetical protein
MNRGGGYGAGSTSPHSPARRPATPAAAYTYPARAMTRSKS